MIKPMVSIILPVYNVGKYLETALSSIEDQTYPNYEVIAVNDGSTDDSLLILKKYQEQIKEMKIVNQKNQGLSMARNVGTTYATGKYIYYFDPDDIIQPNLLELCIKMMEDNQLDLLQFDVDTFFDGIPYDATRVLYPYRKIPNSAVYSTEEFLSKVSARTFRAPVWQFMYRKSFLMENKLSFEPYILWEDLLFSPIAVCSANKIGVLKDVLYRYRIRQGSITNNKNKDKIHKQKNSSKIIIQKLVSYKTDFPSTKKQKFINQRIHLLLVDYYRKYGWNELQRILNEFHLHLCITDYLRILKSKLSK